MLIEEAADSTQVLSSRFSSELIEDHEERHVSVWSQEESSLGRVSIRLKKNQSPSIGTPGHLMTLSLSGSATHRKKNSFSTIVFDKSFISIHRHL